MTPAAAVRYEAGGMDYLARIAAALERIAPPPPAAADPAAHPAYVWRDGALVAARAFAPLPLAVMTGIDRQRDLLVETVRRHVAGLPAHDVLLWGSRGTGKSSLVKSVVGAAQADGGDVALVEVAPDRLAELPHLFATLAACPRAFVLFVDDLGFAGSGEARVLRSLLEGGAEARPGNVRLMVTANRRHIVSREFADEERAVNARDVADDALALSDRFGLSLGFHNADQATYLAIVARYAAQHGLPFDTEDAIAWATGRGARSGRVAWQYVVDLAGREGRML